MKRLAHEYNQRRMRGFYRRWGKRILDVTVSLFGLLLLLIPLAVLWIVTMIKMGNPVLFQQQRAGWMGRIFKLNKFRTMRNDRLPDGSLAPDEVRLTSYGKFLRSTSLDELPGLINVIKGDMSLVGPRPLLVQYLPRYSPKQARRHEVRPGITGWAQVNGRNSISWEQKFEHDVWYVDHVSLWLDLKILFMTLGKVVKRSGISSDSHATMTEFMGSEDQESLP